MQDRIVRTIAGVIFAVLLVAALLGQSTLNRILDESAARVCRVEAMNPGATVIVKLQKSEPCDLRAMALEAREAVKAAMAAEAQHVPD